MDLTWLDAVLGVVLLVALLRGLRRGLSVVAGVALGARVGLWVRTALGAGFLRRVDRWLGGLASLTMGALLVWCAAGAAVAHGPAAAAREAERSRVVAVVDRAVPDDVRTWAAHAGGRVEEMVAGLRRDRGAQPPDRTPPREVSV